MEEYRIDLKVRNNIILKKIEEAGYESINDFARKNEITTIAQIGSLINMKISPFTRTGEFTVNAKKIAKALNCFPEDLFSENQLHTVLKDNKRHIEINEAEMKFMLENNHNSQKLLEEIVDEKSRDNAVDSILDTLTPRERKVIEMRFGLLDREYTLKECAQALGSINGETARQIEAKALRKLRHPSRATQLKVFLESYNIDL